MTPAELLAAIMQEDLLIIAVRNEHGIHLTLDGTVHIESDDAEDAAAMLIAAGVDLEDVRP